MHGLPWRSLIQPAPNPKTSMAALTALSIREQAIFRLSTPREMPSLARKRLTHISAAKSSNQSSASFSTTKWTTSQQCPENPTLTACFKAKPTQSNRKRNHSPACRQPLCWKTEKLDWLPERQAAPGLFPQPFRFYLIRCSSA
ncbi:UNVERIFIED_CONTAM: hypothetical protein GTU68_039108 [Idotea baltica]|nr:hypothetical protein [Idotea baltica]